MSLLIQIVEQTREKGMHTEDWVLLRNSYFTGENPVTRLKAWADENGLVAQIDGERITFIPKRRAK